MLVVMVMVYLYDGLFLENEEITWNTGTVITPCSWTTQLASFREEVAMVTCYRHRCGLQHCSMCRYRLPPLDVVVSPDLLVAECSGRGLHPCSSWALQRGRCGGVLHYITSLQLVPHHGQQPGKHHQRSAVPCEWRSDIMLNAKRSRLSLLIYNLF